MLSLTAQLICKTVAEINCGLGGGSWCHVRFHSLWRPLLWGSSAQRLFSCLPHRTSPRKLHQACPSTLWTHYSSSHPANKDKSNRYLTVFCFLEKKTRYKDAIIYLCLILQLFFQRSFESLALFDMLCPRYRLHSQLYASHTVFLSVRHQRLNLMYRLY